MTVRTEIDVIESGGAASHGGLTAALKRIADFNLRPDIAAATIAAAVEIVGTRSNACTNS
jgi:hypothetical protein